MWLGLIMVKYGEVFFTTWFILSHAYQLMELKCRLYQMLFHIQMLMHGALEFIQSFAMSMIHAFAHFYHSLHSKCMYHGFKREKQRGCRSRKARTVGDVQLKFMQVHFSIFRKHFFGHLKRHLRTHEMESFPCPCTCPLMLTKAGHKDSILVQTHWILYYNFVSPNR